MCAVTSFPSGTARITVPASPWLVNCSRRRRAWVASSDPAPFTVAPGARRAITLRYAPSRGADAYSMPSGIHPIRSVDIPAPAGM